MKSIYCRILAAATVALAAASCSGIADEPAASAWNPGEAPLGLKAVPPVMSRAGEIDPNAYDIYTCPIRYGGDGLNGYYKIVEIREEDRVFHRLKFSKMIYNGDLNLYYFDDRFYPIDGKMDMFSYGLPKGKAVLAYAYPDELPSEDDTAEYMTIDLVDHCEHFPSYDGTYEIFVADRMRVVCNPHLQISETPFARYHYVQARLSFKFVWDHVNVAADAPIVDRLYINSIEIKDTPYRGICRIYDKVKYDFKWPEEDVEKCDAFKVPGFSHSKVNYTNGLKAPKSVYIIPNKQRQPLIINYSIVNGDSDSYTSTNKRTMNYVVADIPDDVTKGWLAGHSYNYTIKIGKNGELTVSNVAVTLIGYDSSVHTETTDI